jgi:hypothetical protein
MGRDIIVFVEVKKGNPDASWEALPLNEWYTKGIYLTGWSFWDNKTENPTCFFCPGRNTDLYYFLGCCQNDYEDAGELPCVKCGLMSGSHSKYNEKACGEWYDDGRNYGDVSKHFSTKGAPEDGSIVLKKKLKDGSFDNKIGNYKYGGVGGTDMTHFTISEIMDLEVPEDYEGELDNDDHGMVRLKEDAKEWRIHADEKGLIDVRFVLSFSW